MYQIEVIWNREFQYCKYSEPYETLASAIKSANSALESGDGERVKHARILDNDGLVVWEDGNKVR